VSDLTLPSKEFMDAVCNSGSPDGDCQLCGRRHFASGSRSDIDAGDLANYRARAQENPELYCESDDDGISFGFLDGQQVVWGCPCGRMRRYEDFIWSHREMIVTYIKARSKMERDEAQRALNLIGGSEL
jgi:hypothetical protein